MSQRRLLVALTLMLTLLLPATVLAQIGSQHRAIYALSTTLDGGNETPPGDPDGFGYSRVTIFLTTGELCFSLSVARIGTATAAHIHAGAAGVNGPVVVPLETPAPDGLSRGCVSVDGALLNAILAEPWNYYVNVHNADYPGGALRGQLELAGRTPPPTGPLPQNAVLDWNRHAVTAYLNAAGAATPGAGLTPAVASIYLAMVQGAVYDAVNTIDGGHQSYLADLPEAPASASMSAAAATAAHDVMVGVVMMPELSPVIVDRLDALLAESIAAAISLDGQAAVNAGIAAGEAAAEAMLAARADDGRYSAFSFTPGTEPGQWRPEPPSNISDPFAWVAKVDPFLVESASQFRTVGPLDMTSDAYATEYNEVKTLGGPTLGSSRTAEQEAVAQFFTANPVEMINRMFRTMSVSEGLTLVEQARLFAMLNMAVADALITTTDDKAFWSFWRPITAIQHGDEDGNPNTVGDPAWTPMVGTPPYPDHPSGYNAVSGAFMYTAAHFFGTDEMAFSLVKIAPDVPNVTRDYTRFSDVCVDTIDARIYQGIHFRTPDVQGAEIGKNVANWLNAHYFQPVN